MSSKSVLTGYNFRFCISLIWFGDLILNSLSPGKFEWNFLHYRQKIWNIFYFSDFLHFCGVCMAFLYLKYIPTSRYYFWGSLFALNSKMKSKGSKTIMSLFFSIRLWLEFLLSLGQIAAISIRLLYRDIVNNTSFYLPPNLVRSNFCAFCGTLKLSMISLDQVWGTTLPL